MKSTTTHRTATKMKTKENLGQKRIGTKCKKHQNTKKKKLVERRRDEKRVNADSQSILYRCKRKTCGCGNPIEHTIINE